MSATIGSAPPTGPAARRRPPGRRRAAVAAFAAAACTLFAQLGGLAAAASGSASAAGRPAAVPAAGTPGTPAATVSGSASSVAGAVGGPRLATRGIAVHGFRGAPRLPAHLSAAAWLVADLDTGQVLAARDPHGRYLPASTLKTLTAVTLIPELSKRRLITATNADAGVDGSKVGVVPHASYRVSDLFTAMLVVSGNDAADTLADGYGGYGKTVDAMNAEAAQLQARDTVAKTPDGLDAPGQHSSAYDLAVIARAAMKLPDFRHYVAIRSGTFPAPGHKHFQIFTHDRLLLNYPGAIGVKNGYTVAAKASFVGAATRGGHTLVVTLLHANPDVWKEAAALLDWGFAAEAHVQPVGRLVDPVGATPVTSAAAAAPTRTAALGGAPARDHTSAAAAAPYGAAVGAVIAGVGAVRLRLRRRRRRSSSRRRPLAMPRRY